MTSYLLVIPLIIAQAALGDLAPLIGQIGWPGVVLLIVVKWLQRLERAIDRSEHTNRGLSKALWMDLASRPYSSAYIKAEADRMITRMDATANKGKGGSED